MSPNGREFFEEHKGKIAGRVLEVGSYDVNGTLNKFLPETTVRTDMRAGPNVDLVCPADRLIETFGEQSFDTVVSSDALEHIEDWRSAIRNMWGVLKDGGWFLCSMASIHKGRHDYPNDYHRATLVHLLQIWPDADKIVEGLVSICWAVQKTRSLPDLEQIELLKVE